LSKPRTEVTVGPKTVAKPPLRSEGLLEGGWVWWHTAIIPFNQEAELGGSLFEVKSLARLYLRLEVWLKPQHWPSKCEVLSSNLKPITKKDPISKNKPGLVVYTCGPSYLKFLVGGKGGVCISKTLSKKNKLKPKGGASRVAQVVEHLPT
jgi:hypothetical protein